MIRIPLLVLVLTGALGLKAQPANTPAYFIDYPTLTPDGSTIIFNYENDLWRVPATGGTATRIMAMSGNEYAPAVSPDGKWLAFTATQFGNPDVFVMPLEGGPVKQLTFHQAGDRVSSWSWDSRRIYFTSNRYNRITTFTVDVDGGTPARLFGHYFNTIHNVAEHPLTKAIYFNESWESNNFANRKGYKGPFNPDIKSYNPQSGKYQKHTDYEGKDFGATIDRQGHVYFVSDEYNGEYNLYTFDKERKKRLTNFTSSIWRPFVSADGSRVVFRRDYQLFCYDVRSGETRQVDVRVARNNTLEQAQAFNVKGRITAFAASDDGKKLALVSRGQLFVSDPKGKFIQQLSTPADERVMEVYWLKDNRTLLFSRTTGGYLNWFTIGADGKTPERKLTSDLHNNRYLTFNSDKTRGLYLGGRHELRLMDLNTFESTTLLRDEFWDLYSDAPRFAPDDRHVIFTAYRNFERDIFLHDLANSQTTNLTRTGVTEATPLLTPDARYLFFTSNRTKPNYPFGSQSDRLYRVPFSRVLAPFRSDKVAELFAEKDTTQKKEKPVLVVQTEGLMDRIELMGPDFGSQGGLAVATREDKTMILFESDHAEGKDGIWKLTLQPFEPRKTEQVQGLGEIGGSQFQQVKDKAYLLTGGNLYTLNLDDNKATRIELDYTFYRQLRPEFEQMFEETWANLEQNFYDGDFHGVDWKAMRDRYSGYLPFVNSRQDLRQLLNDLLGELNTSHFGFSSNGDEERTFFGARTLATGIRFSEDDPYQIAGIVRHSPADFPELDLRPGDQLVKVNGIPVDPKRNRESYFVQPQMPDEIALSFLRESREFTVKIHPVDYSQVESLIYDEWMNDCQQRVDEKSGRRIAYIHMKNMGTGELQRFLQESVSEGLERDGLILDLRYNTGGNVHDEVLRFLSQRPYLQWKYRDGALSPQPNFAPAAKPIVLLINEQSLSDAEMTTEGFKKLGLGTVVGTATYRWIIFTSGKGLVDGSFYRLPAWGCYRLDGKNLEKTGVEPDVPVHNTFLDRLQGRDPQLDKAIDLILGKLGSNG